MNNFLKRFAPLLMLAAYVGLAPPASAQTQAAPNAAQGSALYRDAVVLLRNGRKYEVCISKLHEAVRQQPTNAEFHLALGCALASRAVSVGDAARQAADYPKKQADYKLACAVWETAQNKPDSFLYGHPRPVPPAQPATQDDGKVFDSTPEQTQQIFEEHTKEAIKEWEAAVTAAQTDAQKAQAHFTAGWGKSILRLGRFDLPVSEATQKALSKSECVKEMKRGYCACTG